MTSASKDSNTFNMKSFMLLMLIASIFTITACVPEQKVSKSRTSGDPTQEGGETEKEPPADPTFSNSLNFLQNGTDQTTSTLLLNSNFESGIYLRGKSVNSYIKNFSIDTTQCLVAYFPNSLVHKYFVMAATPRFFTNFSTKVKEYYYWLELNNKTTNQTFCQTTGIVNTLTNLGETIGYSLAEVCPTCMSGTILSNGLTLRNSSGSSIDSVVVNNLSIRLNHSSNSGGNTNPIGVSCTSSTTCKALGYDCCSSGQCVNDKQVRNGVDTSSQDFQDILSLIAINPNRIYEYPEVFHFCSVVIQPTPTPVPTTNPEQDAYQRFLMLKEAYECTTPIEGEMSICTVNYKDIQGNLGPFETRADDRNFQTTYTGLTPPPSHSIYEVEAYGVTLFKHDTIYSPHINIGPNNNQLGNDNLNDVMDVSLKNTFVPPTNPTNKDIKIKYKVDGSCTQVSSALAKCEKYYVQGQNLGKINDHFPASNQFRLPLYANINNAIKVEVDGITKLLGTQYQVVPTSPAYVQFIGSGLQVYDTQTVKITFFVQLDANENLMLSKNLAKQKINEVCGCPDLSCYLTPVYETVDGVSSIKDYTCTYPQNDTTEPPLQQTVLLSSKTVPHRFFDESGVAHATVNYSTPKQEGRAFAYKSSDLLKPNNLDGHIGFNEIYGSLNFQAGGAKPAHEVKIKNSRTYDIFVDTGTFSTCYYCGTDYYTSVAKIFPENFTNKGGGYAPDKTATNPLTATPYRKDDLIFGRACFVPATMIPWTHNPFSDLSQQRQRRLEAQHFLFSNGYQRDWYGFDYGSIIGSFDGVRWFSIGTQRRIKSTSDRLYLAVNAYFGDLAVDSNFTIVVSDATTAPSSGSSVSTDFDSDGAQCQQMHQCNTDRDCATQLGWEYSCEVVSGVRSNWPMFDSNGNELPDLTQSRTLFSLIGSTNGGNKRCVYRGRGAPCSPNYDVADPESSYAGSSSPAINACSDNNYCQRLVEGGVFQSTFNSQISRYGKSVKTLNATTGSEHNTFGLESPLLGRPESYIGTKTADPVITNTLFNNAVNAICLPGRSPEPGSGNSIMAQHTDRPSQTMSGDKVNALGMTSDSLMSDSYLASCRIFDGDNNYFKTKSAHMNKSLNDIDLVRLSGQQAISTNSLQVLENLSLINITRDFLTEHITSIAMEDNRCLRAPGSACHTDLDCAPSKYIADRVKSINPDNVSNHNYLNKYEIQFWQEELICSQPTAKTDENYSLKNNYCCREVGKTITIPTLVDQSGFTAAPTNQIPVFNNTAVPGIDIPLDDRARYTRNSIVYNELQNGSLPPLGVTRADRCGTGLGCEAATSALEDQFKTFSKIAERTSCTGHWVRQFASGERGNGGGNRWGPSKAQNIKMESFNCLNWMQGAIPPFTCAGIESPDDPECLARSISNSEAKPIFEWLMTLELTGIPQVTVVANAAEIQCQAYPGTLLPDILKNPGATNSLTTAIPEYDDGGIPMYIASDITNFDDKLKRIFSENEVKTCHPAGTEMPAGADPTLCCTGFINGTNNKCQLQDYSNVSLFFNRYVSSAAKNLTESFFDKRTGYIKSPSLVEQLACTEKVCASGVIARGVALSDLKVPGHENNQIGRRRFLDGKTQANNFNGKADLYEAGLRWNEAVYCVPQDIDANSSALVVLDCNGF